VCTGKKFLSKSAISFAWIFESIAFFIMLGGERFREIRSPSGHAKARNRGDRRTAFPSSYQYECSTLNIRVGVSHVAPIAIFFPYRKRLFALSLCNKRDMRREDEQISHFAGIVWAGGRYGGLELHRFPSEFWTPARFINFTLPWFFFALTNPQVVQRLFIPKDEHSFNRMVLFFSLYGFIYTLIVTGIGFYARHGAAGGLFPLVQDRDRVIIEILSRMHTWLSISLALSIVFASVSTANSIILTLSSMVSRNIFRTRKNIVVGKSFLFILTGLVFLFSIYRPYYIVELAVSSSSILLCTLPLLFGIFYWKKGGPLTAATTLLCGAATAIVTRAFGVSLSSVYTFFVSFALFFSVSSLEKPTQWPQ